MSEVGGGSEFSFYTGTSCLNSLLVGVANCHVLRTLIGSRAMCCLSECEVRIDTFGFGRSVQPQIDSDKLGNELHSYAQRYGEVEVRIFIKCHVATVGRSERKKYIFTSLYYSI